MHHSGQYFVKDCDTHISLIHSKLVHFRLALKMDINITVVGSCNTDFISYVPRMPSLGETIVGDRFEVGFGGKGANQCVMSAKLGAKVGMVAKVGDDLFGSQTIANFKSHQVDTKFVSVAEGTSSGVAPICVTPGGENTIVIIPGANSLLTTGEVDKATDMIRVSKVLLCQLEIPQLLHYTPLN